MGIFNIFKKNNDINNLNINNLNKTKNNKINNNINDINNKISFKITNLFNTIKNNLKFNINPLYIIILIVIIVLFLLIFVISKLYLVFYDNSLSADKQLLKINNKIPFLAWQDGKEDKYTCFYNRYLYKNYGNIIDKSDIKNIFIKKKEKKCPSKKIGENCVLNSDCIGYDYYHQDNPNFPICYRGICTLNRDIESDDDCDSDDECKNSKGNIGDRCNKNSDCKNSGYVYDLSFNKDDYKNRLICCDTGKKDLSGIKISSCTSGIIDLQTDDIVCNTEFNIEKNNMYNREINSYIGNVFKNKWLNSELNNQLPNNHTYSFWIYNITNMSSLNNYFMSNKELNKNIKSYELDDYFEKLIYKYIENEYLLFSKGLFNTTKFGYPTVKINKNQINIYFGNKKNLIKFNINGNEWINITITINKNFINVYKNGKMIRDIFIDSIGNNKNDLYLLYLEFKENTIKGFPGFFNYFNYYNRTLKSGEINTLYNNYKKIIDNLNHDVYHYQSNINKNINKKK